MGEWVRSVWVSGVRRERGKKEWVRGVWVSEGEWVKGYEECGLVRAVRSVWVRGVWASEGE